jgi:hypothetical protein
MCVGIGSSSHDLSGAFMTIFLISSGDTGRKTIIGSPSNSISAHKASMSLMLSRFDAKISEIGHDQKQLYKVTNNLLGKTKETLLPSILDHYEFGNRFGDFFIGKIETIRSFFSFAQ